MRHLVHWELLFFEHLDDVLLWERLQLASSVERLDQHVVSDVEEVLGDEASRFPSDEHSRNQNHNEVALPCDSDHSDRTTHVQALELVSDVDPTEVRDCREDSQGNEVEPCPVSDHEDFFQSGDLCQLEQFGGVNLPGKHQ